MLFRSAVVGDDGRIYCMPSNSTKILVINTAENSAMLTDLGAYLSGTVKWRMSVNGGNGKLYGMPNMASDVLIIDPIAETAVRSSMNLSWAETEGAWRSGSVPFLADKVLQIRPGR